MAVRIVTRGPGAAPEQCRTKHMHLDVVKPGAPGTVRLVAMGAGRRIWYDLTEEAAEEIAADILTAVGALRRRDGRPERQGDDRPYRQPSDCKTAGRYVTPRAVETWRLDEDGCQGWQRWDVDAGDGGEWVDNMPDELLHYVPPVDGEVA